MFLDLVMRSVDCVGRASDLLPASLVLIASIIAAPGCGQDEVIADDASPAARRSTRASPSPLTVTDESRLVRYLSAHGRARERLRAAH